MPSPVGVYGAFAAHIANNVSGLLGGVWVCEEPENQIRPYAVVEDKGFVTEFQFESEYVANGSLAVHVFADNSATAAALAALIKALLGPYNSEASITTDGTFDFIEVTETGFQLAIEPDPDKEGPRVYRYTIDYKVGIEGTY